MERALVDETSEVFLGKWKRLVSTTNWEKGRIVLGWRQALIASGAPSGEYSDDAWSQRVGNVTPQHVGRLRRVSERFGDGADNYAGLFWSHFQASLDWDDAEMWLEGAVQNDWSISEMRAKRAETLGTLEGTAEQAATDEDAAAGDWDQDAGDAHDGALAGELNGLFNGADGRPPFDDDDEGSSKHRQDRRAGGAQPADDYPSSSHGGETGRSANGAAVAEPVRPFANLPSLPDDVGEAFEAFKLCVLRHKLSGWQEISRDDLLASLDALKELALAPTAE